MVASPDGAIWFTDPTHGSMSDYEGFRSAIEQPARHVFRVIPDGTLAPVVSNFVQSNGLALSPDKMLLYIADSAASHDPAAPRHIWRLTARA